MPTDNIKFRYLGATIMLVHETIGIMKLPKEVLAWAMNKYFQFSNNVMLLKTFVSLSYQRIASF